MIDDAGTYTNGATKYGTIIVKPADPTFAGHSFGGWFTDDDLTIPLEAGATMPDIDLTLYARWVMEDPTTNQLYREAYPGGSGWHISRNR